MISFLFVGNKYVFLEKFFEVCAQEMIFLLVTNLKM